MGDNGINQCNFTCKQAAGLTAFPSFPTVACTLSGLWWVAAAAAAAPANLRSFLRRRPVRWLHKHGMALEASIGMLAEDISDAFAREVRRSIHEIVLQERELAAEELKLPTVSALVPELKF